MGHQGTTRPKYRAKVEKAIVRLPMQISAHDLHSALCVRDDYFAYPAKDYLPFVVSRRTIFLHCEREEGRDEDLHLQIG
jgi:hypothetical protein